MSAVNSQREGDLIHSVSGQGGILLKRQLKHWMASPKAQKKPMLLNGFAKRHSKAGCFILVSVHALCVLRILQKIYLVIVHYASQKWLYCEIYRP